MVPIFADQFENARRIVDAGGGRAVEAELGPDAPTRRLPQRRDAQRIAQSIKAVVASPSYRRRARATAAEMAAEPGTDELIAAFAATDRVTPGTL
jgi:UDP:flavonoid glycosyltransferase YjiC (YdhE family)